MYNGDYSSDRYSPLAAINRDNIGELHQTCEALLGDAGSFQSGPLVVGDTLFVTTVHTTVALSAVDCTVRWRHVYAALGDEPFPNNRGVAYADGKLFRGTADGRLLALDASNGKELWRIKAADSGQGEYFAASPLVWERRVIIGPGGGDFGIRGRVCAFETDTGEQAWCFHTVPGPGEVNYDTWRDAGAFRHGGGSTWSTYTLDAESGELFVSVGNPAPDFNPGARPGDNLYTDSMVVLDVRTGALRWYYQLDPNDGLDYDLTAAPLLVTDRAGRRRIALGSKDGFVYLIDRESHQLVWKTPVTSIKRPSAPPPAGGVYACPGEFGGVQWNGPAYSSLADQVYVGSVDWCATFSSGAQRYAPMTAYLGTAAAFKQDEAQSGWIYALTASGEVAWRYHADSPVLSGVTPTASGLLFSGEAAGNLLVFDAARGTLLHKQALGGSMGGGIITYSVAGRQYVATTTGNISRAGFSPVGTNTPKLVVMAVGDAAAPLLVDAVPMNERNRSFGVDQGKAAYNDFCAGCHGVRGVGGESGPSLRAERRRKSLTQIIQWIKNPDPPMPNMYLHPLMDAEVEAIGRYVEGLK
jgi:alcohol dehydrogenase (cytochrome c)